MRTDLMRADLMAQDEASSHVAFQKQDLGWKNPFAAAAAAGESGLVLATGAYSGILGGATGYAAGIIAGFDANTPTGSAPDIAEGVRQRVTGTLQYTPKTALGKDVLEKIALPLQKVEESADWVSVSLSQGNPYAATAIKTVLIGGADIAMLLTGLNARIPAQLRMVQKTAKDLGINLESGKMRSDVVDAARRMSPEERAQNAPALHRALREAKKAAKKQVEAKFESVKQTKAYVETGRTKDLGKDLRKNLFEDDLDLQEMPIVEKRLGEIENLDISTPGRPGNRKPRAPAAKGDKSTRIQRFGAGLTRSAEQTAQRIHEKARLGDLIKIRKRINHDLRSSKDGPTQLALNRVKKGIDDFIDAEFNRDAISGDSSAALKWKEAISASHAWHVNFTHNKVVAQLTETGATAETYSQWLRGASAMGAKAEAGKVIDHIKGILGDSHPAIEGIRQDVIFDVVAPLLQETPNFPQFIRNYDRLIVKNPTMVDKLNLDRSALTHLRNYASTAEKLGQSQTFMSQVGVIQAISQLSFGHQISKKALKVRMGRVIMNHLIGGDRVSQRAIWADLTNAQFGKPVLPRNGVAAGMVISSQALTNTVAGERLETR
jgi:hypothetical protein